MTSLLLTALTTLSLGQVQSDLRLLRYPDINGDSVVFTYAGDLWKWTGSGISQRLTTHPGEELRAKFSPDGKWIAFTGVYDGNPDLFVIPAVGGEPKRLTFESGADYAVDWTPEGKIAYITSYGGFKGQIPRLLTIDPKGGIPETTPILEIHQGTISPDGNTVVYQRFPGSNQWWRNYRGGMQPYISLYNIKTNTYSELPHKREMSAFPMSIGNSVYFISDKNLRTMNLYKYDLGSKRESQLTEFKDADIRWPSNDGKSIAFERDGLLYKFDITSEKVEAITPAIVSDNWGSRPQLRKLETNIDGFSLSPSGNRIAIMARGELFSVPAKNGETRNLTESSGARERLPAWSPDGKTIAYFSDVSGDYQLYVRPQMGGAATQLTTAASLNPLGVNWSPDGKYITFPTRDYGLYMVEVESKKLTSVVKDKYQGIPNFAWSPDSKWIAVIENDVKQFGRVKLYEVATGQSTQVTDGSFPDVDVAFDASGKYLYFVSNRTFNPSFGLFEFSLKVEEAARIYAIPLTKDLANPFQLPVDEENAAAAAPPAPGPVTVKIDWAGLAERALPLPVPPSNYGLIAGLNEGLLFAGPGGLQKFDIKSREIQTIFAFPAQISLNPANTKIAFSNGGQIYIQDLRPGLQPGAGRVNMGNVEMVVDPRAEWKQMFWEVWRYERDFFYNGAMNGADWAAIGKLYERYLPSVNNRLDIAYVLGLLIGELETGHAYVQGFGSPNPNPVPTGLLGADYEVSNGKVRFKKIYPGANYEESLRSPLGEPGLGIAEGEYLLAIDGKPVSASTNPNSLLVGKVGRTVVLTVNSTPSDTGARTVRVRPVADESAIRYTEWVESNRKMVEKLGGGRIGYFHVTNTSTDGAVGIIKGFYGNTDKEALLVDERYNGGGFIQPWFVDTLARTTKARIVDRNGVDWNDAVSIEGPKALLINGYAGSGGDFFPFLFRQAKLGPLIGTRTWGGLVGIRGGIPLIDGGSVTAPEFGIYDHRNGEFIAENKGVDPDIDVDLRPDMLVQGRDLQIERGVAYLLEELKKYKPVSKRPAFPKIPPK